MGAQYRYGLPRLLQAGGAGAWSVTRIRVLASWIRLTKPVTAIRPAGAGLGGMGPTGYEFLPILYSVAFSTSRLSVPTSASRRSSGMPSRRRSSKAMAAVRRRPKAAAPSLVISTW